MLILLTITAYALPTPQVDTNTIDQSSDIADGQLVDTLNKLDGDIEVLVSSCLIHINFLMHGSWKGWTR